MIKNMIFSHPRWGIKHQKPRLLTSATFGFQMVSPIAKFHPRLTWNIFEFNLVLQQCQGRLEHHGLLQLANALFTKCRKFRGCCPWIDCKQLVRRSSQKWGQQWMLLQSWGRKLMKMVFLSFFFVVFRWGKKILGTENPPLIMASWEIPYIDGGIFLQAMLPEVRNWRGPWTMNHCNNMQIYPFDRFWKGWISIHDIFPHVKRWVPSMGCLGWTVQW